jgi:hypothetical protein
MAGKIKIYSRDLRGKEIANNKGHVKKTGENSFKVKSQSGKGIYEVKKTKDGPFEVENLFIKISWAPIVVWKVVYSSTCNLGCREMNRSELWRGISPTTCWTRV